MTVLMTAAAAARVEKAGCDLADVCRVISAFKRRERCPIRKREAIIDGKRTMRANKAISAMIYTVMCGDDSLELIKVGKRGGVTRITRLLDRNGKPV